MRTSHPDLHPESLQVQLLDAARGATTRITLPEGGDLVVAIPKRLADGRTPRLRGRGGPGAGGGGQGEALVTVTARPHPHLTREGDDIHVVQPISVDEGILGAKVTALTIDGPVSLTIPQGASSGRTLRLRARAASPQRGARPAASLWSSRPRHRPSSTRRWPRS